MKNLLLCLLTATLCLLVSNVHAETYYVKMNGQSSNSGKSWEKAVDLQTAINKAGENDIIKIAEGTYLPTRLSGDPAWHGNRTKSFLIRDNITIKGGYSAGSTTGNEIRDIGSYKTILSGINSDQSYHVVIIAGVGDSRRIMPVLDGLTITGGHAESSIWADKQVNVYYDRKGTPIVNVNKDYGAGLYIFNANPTIANVIVADNIAKESGGGIALENANPNFYNVLIKDNKAGDTGGGVYIHLSTKPKLVNVAIRDNEAGNEGDGIYIDKGAEPKLFNSIVYGNEDNIANSDQGEYENTLVQGKDLKGENNLSGNTDPKWDENCRLIKGSPLINSGEKNHNTYETDLDGKQRVKGRKIDIGPYEFMNTDSEITFIFNDQPEDVDPKIEINGKIVSNPYKLDGEKNSLTFKVIFPEGYQQFELSTDNIDIPDGISVNKKDRNVFELTGIGENTNINFDCSTISVDKFKVTVITDDHAKVKGYTEPVNINYNETYSFELDVDEGYTEEVKIGDNILAKQGDSYITNQIKEDTEITVTTTQNQYSVSFVNGIAEDKNALETYLTITDETGYNRDVVAHGSDMKFDVALIDKYSKTKLKVAAVNDKGDTFNVGQETDGTFCVSDITSDIVVSLQPEGEGLEEWPVNRYDINIHLIEGISCSPCTNMDNEGIHTHKVIHDEDFELELRLLNGYTACASNVKIAVDDKTIDCTQTNHLFTYQIQDIRKDIDVTVTGVTRNPGAMIYTVELPEVEGLLWESGSSINRVYEGDQFEFRFSIEEGYDDSELKVTTDRGETLTQLPSGAYVIENVRGDVKVSIEGIIREGSDPDPEEPGVSNTEVESTEKVYSEQSTLFIEVSESKPVIVYTINGKTLLKQQVHEGQNTFRLEDGIYIVRLGNTSYKIYVRR